MIFYFTGTGNSKWIAELLSQKLDERLVSINELLKSEIPSYDFDVKEGERIVLVFPVYSWGLPTPIRLFIERLKLTGATEKEVYAVATCGDNAGLMDKMLKKKLEENNLHLASCHTVQMPNCYIVIPGFDVDRDEVADDKIAHAEARVDLIVKAILENRQDKTLYSKGSLPWIKSRLIYPSFIKYTYKTKFYATEACNHCGLCAKLCPMNNITIKDGSPAWSEKCVQCLACINRCPQRAIEYGKITPKKGRYYFKCNG
ncbi:MAG: EFR1 family ferrodoxin [Bacteroidales bacterium]|nr:EFR1 family ferrodoxin [Bacteroidales bacterium]